MLPGGWEHGGQPYAYWCSCAGAGDRRLGRKAGGLLTLGGPRGPLLKMGNNGHLQGKIWLKMVKSGYFHSNDGRIGPPGALCGDKMVKNGTYLPTPETSGVSMLVFTPGFEKKSSQKHIHACGAKKQGGPLEEILTSLKCDPKGATLVSPIW